MQIRPERPEDASAIGAITTDAFRNASHSGGNEARIIEALRAADALTISLVGTDDGGAIIGHVAFSPVEIDQQPGKWFGLGPVSVPADLQCRGIGSALIREGLARLEALGADGCILLGDPAYYARFDFMNGDALTYLGYVTPNLQWRAFAGPAPRGAVTYHPAFDVA